MKGRNNRRLSSVDLNHFLSDVPDSASFSSRRQTMFTSTFHRVENMDPNVIASDNVDATAQISKPVINATVLPAESMSNDQIIRKFCEVKIFDN